MSTTIEKPLTLTQQSAAALEQAAAVIGASDLKALAAAINGIALEAIRSDGSFASQVRSRYAELTARSKPKKAAAPRQSQPKSAPPELVVRHQVPMRSGSVGAAPDPYYLLAMYEADQLPLALERYGASELKLAAELVQQKNPGTKPTNKGNRKALIDYIVHYVVN